METITKERKYEMEIPVFGDQTIRRFQEILNDYYSKSFNTKFIKFDCSRLEWIGFFPASLMFVWVAALLNYKNGPTVDIILPADIKQKRQVAKILLDYGLIARLKEMGANAPYYFSKPPDDGLSYKNLTEFGKEWPKVKDKIWQTLQSNAENLVDRLNIPESNGEIIKNAFEIILYELIENTYIHASCNTPYFAVSYSMSAGSNSSSRGLIPPFAKNTPYIEIVAGDLGIGINRKLEKLMPSDFRPPYNGSHRYLKAEKVLSYAFDFYSTSDPEKRQERILEIINEDNIDFSRIATGLFCVLEMTRENQGQILIRSPQGILSYDFYKNSDVPIVKGRNNLGLKKLSSFKGTHYLIRLPLALRKAQKNFFKQATLDSPLEYSIVDVVNPFENYSVNEDLVPYLDKALDAVSIHLNRHRNVKGITLLMPPDFPMISRAIAAFVMALKFIPHGKRILFWCNPRALSILSEKVLKETNKLGAQKSGFPVIIGDIATNEFFLHGHFAENFPAWLKPLNKKNLYSLEDQFFSRLKNKYIHSLANNLRLSLKRSDVLHTDATFLIEGKYYTQKYYEIPKAFYNSNQVRRYAEWISHKIGPDLDILIAGSASVKKVVDEVAKLFGVENNYPQILEFNPPYKPATIITKTLPYSGKKATIITDVICRGSNLNDILLFMPNIHIRKVISIVDARALHFKNQTFTYKQKEKREVVDFEALLKDEIEPLNDPPTPIEDIEDNELEEAIEKIYVIDPTTKAPALYVRHTKPIHSFSGKIKEAVHESNSMICGHSDYDDKHYFYFLNLPRLIYSLEKEIKDWIQKNIGFINKVSTYSAKSWNGLVYDPNTSYEWVSDYLTSDPLFNNVDLVKKDDLLAPRPPQPDSKVVNWIIILPAIASGETARLCIEYVSRKFAKNILLLSFMARMDPYHRSFFSGIRKYRDSKLRVSFFLDFPIGAFEKKAKSCPLCTEVYTLENLLSNTKEKFTENNKITLAIESKLSASRPYTLTYASLKDDISKPISENDIERADIRALYEQSNYSINTRRLLKAKLEKEMKSVDRLLEIISIERHNPIFIESELERRLYRAHPLLKSRLHKIMDGEKPPFPIGRFIGAMIHLIPNAFAGKANEILKRFITSYRDIEEICIGILLLRIYPSQKEDIMTLCRKQRHSYVNNIILETLELLEFFSDRENKDYDQSIKHFAKLWARLERSGYFFDNIKALYNLSKDQKLDMAELKSKIDNLNIGWKSEVSKSISAIMSTPVWLRISYRRPEIGEIISNLDKYVAELDLICKSINFNQPPSRHIGNLIRQNIEQIFYMKTKLSKHINNLFINPVLCEVTNLPNEIYSVDGAKLEVEMEIDQYVHRTFCDLEDLNEVCSQITANWKKHKRLDKKGSKVWFKICRKEKYTCLEFKDDIEGDFDLTSEGGLRMVQEFCKPYGCRLDVDKSKKVGTKSLKLYLRTTEDVK